MIINRGVLTSHDSFEFLNFELLPLLPQTAQQTAAGTFREVCGGAFVRLLDSTTDFSSLSFN